MPSGDGIDHHLERIVGVPHFVERRLLNAGANEPRSYKSGSVWYPHDQGWHY
jgi:hypothetical protein